MSELHEQLQELSARLDGILVRLNVLEDKPVMIPVGYKKRKPSAGHAHDPLFDEFWAVYPRKVGKGAARNAWKKVARKGCRELAIAAVKAYVNSKQWRGVDEEFIPHPTTFLNNERWEDEIDGLPAVSAKPAPTITVQRLARCAVCGEGFNGMGDYCPRHNDPA